MVGVKMFVMSLNGSGNYGLIVIFLIVVYNKKFL